MGPKLSRVRWKILWGTVIFSFVATACAHRFPTPYTTGQLSVDAVSYPGPSLNHYLSQANADPAFCDLSKNEIYLPQIDAKVIATWFKGLKKGPAKPGKWGQCMLVMMPSLKPVHTAQLLTLSTKLYVKWLGQADVDPQKAEVVRALQYMLIHRKPELRLPQETSEWFSKELNAMSEKSSMGPLAAKYSSEMSDAIDVELGRWKGQKITPALIGSLKEEAPLEIFVQRISDTSLHPAAKRRLVQLRIEASPYEIVKKNAEEVEASVMQTGRYELAVSPDQIETTTYSPSGDAAYGILVKQNVMAQYGNLLGFPLNRQGSEANSGLFPTLSLRPDFRFNISNIEKEITLCGPSEALDPSPCIDAQTLRLSSELTELDKDGVLRLKEELGMKEVIELAAVGKTLSVTTSLGEKDLTTIAFSLSFAKPDNLLFVGKMSKKGPAVEVVIEEAAERLFIYAQPKEEGVPSDKRYDVVIDALDTIGYKVGSIGGPGIPGAAGSAGSSGRSAFCPSSHGTGGTRGQNGGPGGRGGNGGDVTVTVRCRDVNNCGPLMEIAAKIAVSEGGRGGPGGQGGKGGSGGSSTTCAEKAYDGTTTTKTLSGGSSGQNGSNGPQGMKGNPGEVTISKMPYSG